jgi:hypothetical protein
METAGVDESTLFATIVLLRPLGGQVIYQDTRPSQFTNGDLEPQAPQYMTTNSKMWMIDANWEK